MLWESALTPASRSSQATEQALVVLPALLRVSPREWASRLAEVCASFQVTELESIPPQVLQMEWAKPAPAPGSALAPEQATPQAAGCHQLYPGSIVQPRGLHSPPPALKALRRRLLAPAQCARPIHQASR